MPATDEFVRDLKLMHKVFCASAVALLAVTLWMMWADDEWRGYQRTALAHVASRDKARIAEIQSQPEHQAAVAEADQQVQLAKQQITAREADLDAIESKIAEMSADTAATMRILREKRAVRDVRRAEYGLKIRDSAPAEVTGTAKAAFDAAQTDADKYETEYAQKAYDLAQAKSQLNQLTKARDDADTALKKLTADVTRLSKAINKIQPENPFSAFKRDLMLLPIINGFNSPERIQQDWLPNLEITLGGMSMVDRFDRCRTCHHMIDSVDIGTNPAFPHGTGEKDSGTYEHPYASHPRLDLYLTAASPHPLPKFGCTICHEGQGSGTSFQNASHTPNDPHEMHRWEMPQQKDGKGGHGWFNNHFWERPMYPDRFKESTCIKCHVNVTELGVNAKFGATAPKVVRGFDLVQTYGCFGCHEIHGFEAGKPIGPDLRLEPSAEDLAKMADDPKAVPGKMRKVGPSLRHLASKTDSGWVEHWTEEPKQFRPTTRMPQFFKLTNQQDATAAKFNPVEIAGMASYLLTKSQAIELMTPKADYQPNAERGKEFFATKGCVACHTHQEMPAVKADFGPELSRVHAKIRPGQEGFNWLYTWIREPERHHPRTKMPHLFLNPEGEGDKHVDYAADIAAFLLKSTGSPADYKPTAEYSATLVDDAALNELVRYFLTKLLTQQQIEGVMQSGVYPTPKANVKGDEIELVKEMDGALDETEWRNRKLLYVGRKSITKYGCYGCHDIPNFEAARPIGTALQDWGKKDTSRLAFEHIHEYLHHHGQPDLGMDLETLSPSDAARLGVEPARGVRISGIEPGVEPLPLVLTSADGPEAADVLQIDDVVLTCDGVTITDARQLSARLRQTVPASAIALTIHRGGQELQARIVPDGSLYERVVSGLEAADNHEFKDKADEERELSAAFYYESLSHHTRPGFLWQKLRQPRSYDYKMTETKPYDDRLRMPKFPFSEEDIDAIATFVLGLRAEPPGPDYMYNPSGKAGDIIRGEQLLEQFNCAGCHLLELPEIRYGANLDDIVATDASVEFPAAVALLKRLKPPRNGLTGGQHVVKFVGDVEDKTDDKTETLPVVGFHGMVVATPNPEDDPDDREYVAELWETLKVGDKELFPTSKLIFPAAALQEIRPARGGQYAEWLANRLVENKQVKQLSLGQQASPPPLYLEGIKVQTPWLYNFLRNPHQIRHTTVLRMPRFNMSNDEARALANYFAAVDNAAYPYQTVPERETQYLAAMNAEFHEQHAGKSHDYLTESWKVLNSPLCVKCHAVGGRQPVSTEPANDIRAPNLEMAGERLRPDWLLLWLYKSPWITPYTSMPQNFLPGKKALEELFDGDGNAQTQAVRDALVNYHRLMERDGRIVYDPMTTTPPPKAGAGGGE
ncbi:MAG: c-type cytochrome [Planctomycetaceae bacterium]|nr:c-type cytochrome [Planctomycetaceae bacterium]